MKDIWNIIISLLLYTGVIGAVIKLFWKNIQDRVTTNTVKKIELKYEKQLEFYKNALDKKIYISKTRFDAEFAIYREVSEAIIDLAFDTAVLFSSGTIHLLKDESEREFNIKRHSKAVSSYVIAIRLVKKNAPFMPPKIYDMFMTFILKCEKQINWYPRFMIDEGGKVLIRELNEEWVKCLERAKEIKLNQVEIINDLREYIQTLDVFDDSK